MAYQDVMLKTYNVAVHKGGSGLGHGKIKFMVVPTLLHEGDLDPVDYWSAINLGSRVNYSAS